MPLLGADRMAPRPGAETSASRSSSGTSLRQLLAGGTARGPTEPPSSQRLQLSGTEGKLKPPVKEPLPAHERRPLKRLGGRFSSSGTGCEGSLPLAGGQLSESPTPSSHEQVLLTPSPSLSSTSPPEFLELVRSVRNAEVSGAEVARAVFARAASPLRSSPFQQSSGHPMAASAVSAPSAVSTLALSDSDPMLPSTPQVLPSLGSVIRQAKDGARLQKVPGSRTSSPLGAEFGALKVRTSIIRAPGTPPPLGVQERELGMRLIERQKHWGSLESSWLVKNAYATWRALLRCKVSNCRNDDRIIDHTDKPSPAMPSPAMPSSTMNNSFSSVDFETFGDLQKAIAAKDDLILDLEQRLSEVIQGEPNLRRHAAGLSAARVLDMCGSEAQLLLRWGFAKIQHEACENGLQRKLAIVEEQLLSSQQQVSSVDNEVQNSFKELRGQQEHRTEWHRLKMSRLSGRLAQWHSSCLLQAVVLAWKMGVETRLHVEHADSLAFGEAEVQRRLSEEERKVGVLQEVETQKRLLTDLLTAWCLFAARTHQNLRRVAVLIAARRRQMLEIAVDGWTSWWRHSRSLRNVNSLLQRLHARALLSLVHNSWFQLCRDARWNATAQAYLQQQAVSLRYRSAVIVETLQIRNQFTLLLAKVLRAWAFTTKLARCNARTGLAQEYAQRSTDCTDVIRAWASISENVIYARSVANMWAKWRERLLLQTIFAEWFHDTLNSKSDFAMDLAAKQMASRLHIWGTDIADRSTDRVQRQALLVQTFSLWHRATSGARITDKVAFAVRWGHTRLWILAMLSEWQRAHAAARWTQATESAFEQLAVNLHSRGVHIAEVLTGRSQLQKQLLHALHRWSQACLCALLAGRAAKALRWGHLRLWLAAIFSAWQSCLRKESYTNAKKHSRQIAEVLTGRGQLQKQLLHALHRWSQACLCALLEVKAAKALRWGHLRLWLAAVFSEWQSVRFSSIWSSCTQNSMQILSARLHQRGVQIAANLVHAQCRISTISEVFALWLLTVGREAHCKRLSIVADEKLALADTARHFQQQAVLQRLLGIWQRVHRDMRWCWLLDERLTIAEKQADGFHRKLLVERAFETWRREHRDAKCFETCRRVLDERLAIAEKQADGFHRKLLVERVFETWRREHRDAKWCWAVQTTVHDASSQVTVRSVLIAIQLLSKCDVQMMQVDIFNAWRRATATSSCVSQAGGFLMASQVRFDFLTIFIEWKQACSALRWRQRSDAAVNQVTMKWALFMTAFHANFHAHNTLTGLWFMFCKWQQVCIWLRLEQCRDTTLEQAETKWLRLNEVLISARQRRLVLARAVASWQQTNRGARYLRRLTSVVTSSHVALSLTAALMAWVNSHALFIQECSGDADSRQLLHELTNREASIRARHHTCLLLTLVLAEWRQSVAAATWDQVAEIAVKDVVSKLHRRDTAIAEMVAASVANRFLCWIFFATWLQALHVVRNSQEAENLRISMLKAQRFRSYQVCLERERCYSSILTSKVMRAWVVISLLEAQRLRSSKVCLARESGYISILVSKVMRAWVVSCLLSSLACNLNASVEAQAALKAQEEQAVQQSWGIATKESTKRLMQIMIGLWRHRARSIRSLVHLGRLKEVFVETHSIIEKLAVWRVWTTTALWKRRQEEVAALLVVAGARVPAWARMPACMPYELQSLGGVLVAWLLCASQARQHRQHLQNVGRRLAECCFRQLLELTMSGWAAWRQHRKSFYNVSLFLQRFHASILLLSFFTPWQQQWRDAKWNATLEIYLSQQSSHLQHRSCLIAETLQHKDRLLLLLTEVARAWALSTERARSAHGVSLLLARCRSRQILQTVICEWANQTALTHRNLEMNLASASAAAKLNSESLDLAHRMNGRVQQRELLVKVFAWWLHSIEGSQISEKVAHLVSNGHSRMWTAVLLSQWHRVHLSARWTTVTESAFHNLGEQLHSRGIDIVTVLVTRGQLQRQLAEALRRWSQACRCSLLESRVVKALRWGHLRLWLAAILSEWQRVRCSSIWSACTQDSLQTLSTKLQQHGVQVADQLMRVQCRVSLLSDVWSLWMLIVREEFHLRSLQRLFDEKLVLAETQANYCNRRWMMQQVMSAWWREHRDMRWCWASESAVQETSARARARGALIAIKLVSQSHTRMVLLELFTAWMLIKGAATGMYRASGFLIARQAQFDFLITFAEWKRVCSVLRWRERKDLTVRLMTEQYELLMIFSEWKQVCICSLWQKCQDVDREPEIGVVERRRSPDISEAREQGLRLDLQPPSGSLSALGSQPTSWRSTRQDVTWT